MKSSWRIIILVSLSYKAFAFQWPSLWKTKDQLAQEFYNKQEYKKAFENYQNKQWQGCAAYKAGDYTRALDLFKSGNSDNSFYNKGNTLVHLGRFKEAIAAYNDTLKINPKHQSAQHNKKLLEELLQHQNKPSNKDNKENKDNKDNQTTKNDNNKVDNTSPNQANNEDKNSLQPQHQNNNFDNKDENKNSAANNPNEKSASSKNEDNSLAKREDQLNSSIDQQHKSKQQEKHPNTASEQLNRDENQIAKDQLLKLIPDNPGGLLKEKFWRDHLRRQSG